MGKPRIILAGERRGALVVTVDRRNGEKRLQCRCDCGNAYSADMNEWSRLTSCGCRKGKQPTHGMSDSPIYGLWWAMIDRCDNPRSGSYSNYGGRGITVCERWRAFENFYADMGDRPDGKSIDRIDNNGNYEPGNCRWATPLEQAANQRPRSEHKPRVMRRPPARWKPVDW